MPKFEIPMTKVLLARQKMLEKASSPRVLTSKEEVVEQLVSAITSMLEAGYEPVHARSILEEIGVALDERTFDKYLRSARAKMSGQASARPPGAPPGGGRPATPATA